MQPDPQIQTKTQKKKSKVMVVPSQNEENKEEGKEIYEQSNQNGENMIQPHE